MRIGQFSVFLSVIICGFLSSPNDAHAASDAAARCGVIRSEDFSGVLDALTQVTDAKFVEEAGAPAYCQVGGYVAPSVGFLLRLPRRALERQIHRDRVRRLVWHHGAHRAMRRPLAPRLCLHRVRRRSSGRRRQMGFQQPSSQARTRLPCAARDRARRKGHRGTLLRTGPPKILLHGLFRRRLAGDVGSSKVSLDFDGIIAGAPALDWTAMEMNELWGALAVADPAGRQILKQGDLEILHRAVVANAI